MRNSIFKVCLIVMFGLITVGCQTETEENSILKKDENINICYHLESVLRNEPQKLNILPPFDYTKRIGWTIYQFRVRGLKECKEFYALPKGKENRLENSTLITIDNSSKIYFREVCIQGSWLIEDNNLYLFLYNGFDKKKHPNVKWLVYQMEDDRLNLKPICEIK